MHIQYLVILVILVMLVAAAATIAIGRSRENRTENPGYSSGTAKKWGRLLVIYVLCAVIVLAIFLSLQNR